MKRVVLATACGCLMLAACSGTSGASTVTVNGVVYFQGASGWEQQSGKCGMDSPAQLTIEDGSHHVLSNTLLGTGTMGAHGCEIPFAFHHVPAGRSQYGVNDTGIGTVWFNGSQIGRPVRLTISGS